VKTIDDLSRLFEAERAVQPPPQAVEHGLSRLLSDLAQQVAPLSVATGSLKLGASFFVSKWLVGGFVVGLAGAGAASQIWAPQAVAGAPTHAVTTVAPTPRLEPATPVLAASPPSLALPTPEPESSEPVRGRNDPPMSSPAPASSQRTTTFDAELRLISAAKSELDKGRPHLAAAWLSEHAESFPAGIFALDREALRILVRCRQARDPQLARVFAERHPDSQMVDRLLRACTPAEPDGSPSAVDFPK
jgi:hypothetical protein